MDMDKYRELMGQRMTAEERCFQSSGLNYCHALDAKVHPTPVYETMMFTAIGSFLWWMRKKVTIPGIIFFVTLFFSGIERYLIESIRVNDKIDFLGGIWTQAEIISVALVLIGIIGSAILWNRHSKSEV